MGQAGARAAAGHRGSLPPTVRVSGSGDEEVGVQTRSRPVPAGGGWGARGLHAPSCCPSLLSPQNPDIVLVHYLNVPAIEDCGKPCGPILCSINTDKKEWAKWTKEELIGQLKPMCE